MASLIEEVKALTMSGEIDKQEQAGSGQSKRLEAVYHRYVGYFYVLCLRLLKSVRAAGEATVQVFVRLGRELVRRMDESRIIEHLRELVIDEALRHQGACRVERPGEEVATWEDSSPLPPTSTSTGERNSRTVTLANAPLDSRKLDALTVQLPTALRIGFVLHDRKGLSIGAVARHLQLKEFEARQLIRQARLELRRLWLTQTEEDVDS